jgi:L,D-peptidoglycan transpeptidase YkuD (ErfK/YbiS/YcfS/YnhG family)
MYRSMAVFFMGCAFSLAGAPAMADENRLGLDAKQMVVCLADDASSSGGTLQLFHRDDSGQWQADGEPWPVLFGRGGLAWGRGINPPQPGPQKTSGDGRNPAGLFKIGFVMGYAPQLPDGAQKWPYHQVTDRDAWIDDPKLTDLPYNHLYTLPPGSPLPGWWAKEYMHLNDDAYQWLVLIEHNYDHPVPEAGNEIFFHVRRGEHYRTAGCTTMKLEDLEHLIKWLQPDSNAMLAELTRTDYARFWKEWHLPPAEKVLGK